MKLNKKLVLPFLLAVLVYLLAYQIPKVTLPEYRLHYLNSSIDDLIQLWSPMFIIYIGAFFQWMYAIIIASKQETNKGYKYASAITIGSLIGFIIFMVYPTAIARPEVIGDGIFDKFARFIYSVDNVICACPSFHCFCSTITILILKDCKGINKNIVRNNEILSVLVYISTLITKQHVLIDIPCGIILAFISMKIAEKITFTKIYDKLNKVLIKKN